LCLQYFLGFDSGQPYLGFRGTVGVSTNMKWGFRGTAYTFFLGTLCRIHEGEYQTG